MQLGDALALLDLIRQKVRGLPADSFKAACEAIREMRLNRRQARQALKIGLGLRANNNLTSAQRHSLNFLLKFLQQASQTRTARRRSRRTRKH